MSDVEKVYVISLRDGNRSVAIQRVERAESMGIACIRGVGRYLQEYKQLNGKVMFVPLSEIQSMTEYESEREYDESAEAAYRARRNSQLWKRLFFAGYTLLFVAMIIWIGLRPAK